MNRANSMRNCRWLVRLLVVFCFGCLTWFSAAASAAVGRAAPIRRPNIIVYMADDLGWNHISAERATMGTHKDIYSTPNLEKMARGGLSFTHAYAQPNCAWLTQRQPTWRPRYPLVKETGRPAGPPPVL